MYALLLAEDSDEAAVLSLVLQRAGMTVTTARDLNRAMDTWQERPTDLVLLAISNPSPRDQVHRVRSEAQIPLIIVVDMPDEELNYTLLEMGADLVVTRPFSARLLIAQVRALLRRAGGVPLFSLPTLSLGGLTLDPATRMVEVSNRPPRRLTHLEFRLLYTLMIHHGQVLPTDAIVERVWGYSGRGDRELVRGLISRLRNKVETDPRNPCFILTVPGVGYSFQGIVE
ncbi:MAG: response regulator transcription factor [Anaerolineae bacterium]